MNRLSRKDTLSTMQNKNVAYLLAAFAGAVAVIGLTLVIYGTFFQDILDNFHDLSPGVEKMIERENPSLVPIALANLAHGFLIATVIQWGKFYAPLRAAAAGAVVACLTEIYFLFTQYALFKTMTLEAAILDTMMWTLINAMVGALVAWILVRLMQKDSYIAASAQP